MTEDSGGTLIGMQVADVTLTDARVRDVDMVRPRFSRIRMRGAFLSAVAIDGEV
jgi:hypothetical protein